jgi:hypothetical protein
MLALGSAAQAKVLFEDALALFRELGAKSGIAAALSNLGRVAHRQGSHGEARVLFAESLRLWREGGQKQGMAAGLEGLAIVAEAIGQPTQAARLFGAAEALREAIGVHVRSSDHDDEDQAIAAIRAILGEDAFAGAWAEGRALPLDQAVALALEHPSATT